MVQQLHASLDLFKAKLSRYIAAWVFTSIVGIELVILIPSYYRQEQEQLSKLERISYEVFSPTLVETAQLSKTPAGLLRTVRQNLKPGSVIRGGALYTINGSLLETFGEPPQLTPKSWAGNGMVQARRYQGDRYDVVWSPAVLNGQYILVVRHDATSVQQELNGFIQRIAVLVLIIAVFVTLATMLTLGFTVINPILRLRDDLLAAGEAITKDLSDPKFAAMAVQRQDELGEVTAAFHDLFRRVRQEICDRRQAEANLRAEQEKADRLLLNILPAEIAEKLKQDQTAIADRFEEVTILFADIVSFTELSTKISPIELVSCLNEIFSAFDQLAEQHDLEKIKTIGDAYMVVGGLPTPRPDHAEAIAQMALDMQREITKFQTCIGTNFQLRIGIHTGTVVAGVIGLKKFSYDLWGDAVNLASRMESHGIVGAIQVSDTTYDRLKHKFLLEKRGLISVKGRGEVLTYLLKS
ncbi:adenylate/guanylate cyclase domain-containing protein [Pantanalinema sp. GBBB05]|uniref:adenylate/guanylate cyclase domain-containing protein n=1 Tax=Pantanalinema sp. GBBB05 TaxID=2604139 RepID=UPI001D2241A9|nr:adenylate/guanylate cyclase domain-containing protein [Pantanalinema sp. GBBB05]